MADYQSGGWLMPRFHNIYHAATQTHERVQFTTAEETARDAEEVQAAIDNDKLAASIARRAVLRAKFDDDTITFEEFKELERLRAGNTSDI